MKTITITLTLLLAMLLTGCGHEQVPPAHVGKLLTTTGYSPDIYPPSRVRVGLRESLVLIETGTKTYKEPLTIIMQDKLTLTADVRFRARVDSTSKPVLNAMFNDIVPTKGLVSLDKVYQTYGKMIVRNKSREVLSRYSVEDVHKNYARISGEIYQSVTKAASALPIKITDVALGNIKYPATITRAAELAKERELQIAQEEAQVQIELTKKAGQQQLAEADYKIKMTQARTLRDQNRTIAEGISPELLELKRIEASLAAAQSNNSKWVLPYSALGHTGAQVAMFNNTSKSK
ncbi:SPFH domain-containing protein [Candidatus Sororendozoicomonas aggregata]|uniref:SPFH domain-containing protein n=1 Tax=Candidatus Sororendozoicomonas aggregata TaxID=3073239 RepID=UPI002ED3F009